MNLVRHSSYCYVQAMEFDVEGGCSALSAAGFGRAISASALACCAAPLCKFTSYTLDEFESSLNDNTPTSSVCQLIMISLVINRLST